MQCFEKASVLFCKRRKLSFADMKCAWEITKLMMIPKVEEGVKTRIEYFTFKKSEIFNAIKNLEQKMRNLNQRIT